MFSWGGEGVVGQPHRPQDGYFTLEHVTFIWLAYSLYYGKVPSAGVICIVL
jgi:hypothetical protein